MIQLIESFEDNLLGQIEIWQKDSNDVKIFCIFDWQKNYKLFGTYKNNLQKEQTVLKLKGTIKDLLIFHNAIDKQDKYLKFDKNHFVNCFMTYEEYCKEINKLNY